MATITLATNFGVDTSSTQSFLNGILPEYGHARCNLPVWNEGDLMFISDEYESLAGNRYYKGLRFSNRLAIVEKVGLYHNWKYIDTIEVYTYDRNSRTQIGSYKFGKQFYDAQLIRATVNKIVQDYCEGQMKLGNLRVKADELSAATTAMVDDAYKSLLADDYNLSLRQLLPVLQPQD